MIQPKLRLARLILIAPMFALAAGPVPALVHQVEQRYNSAVTLSLNFSETYSIQGHTRPTETGTLLLRKRGKMRWDYSQPPGKLFISDGRDVYLYTAGDNRVEKIPLKDTEDMRAPLAFLLGHLDMQKEFRGFETRPGDGGTWLTAAAKNERVPYSKLDMLVAADGEIRKLRVYQRDDSELAFDFSDEKLNPPIPDAKFHFQIPPGAEVVDSVPEIQ